MDGVPEVLEGVRVFVREDHVAGEEPMPERVEPGS